jgi:CubicO group peptidase (beta-lactamase class C family)
MRRAAARTTTVTDMGALDVVATWPVGTAGVAVVDRGGVLASVGLDVDLPWASVTKPLTALCVLVAVERGAVTLDEPAGPSGSTVRHLLAHASGVAPEDDAILSQPGRRRIYSNRGFDLLAEHVAARCGTPFRDLLQASVLDPLGMADTRLEGPPSWGARGPLADLVALTRELLAPTLAPKMLAQAVQTAFPGLVGVLPGYGRQDPNDWGLGFEIRDDKSPHWTGRRNSPQTFGHFGRSGTFMWVDPVAGLGCACLTDRAFGDWAIERWPALADAVLAEYAGSRPG